jgi:hypothetical protein
MTSRLNRLAMLCNCRQKMHLGWLEYARHGSMPDWPQLPDKLKALATELKMSASLPALKGQKKELERLPKPQ